MTNGTTIAMRMLFRTALRKVSSSHRLVKLSKPMKLKLAWKPVQSVIA